jgi:hypothetical protein
VSPESLSRLRLTQPKGAQHTVALLGALLYDPPEETIAGQAEIMIQNRLRNRLRNNCRRHNSLRPQSLHLPMLAWVWSSGMLTMALPWQLREEWRWSWLVPSLGWVWK